MAKLASSLPRPKWRDEDEDEVLLQEEKQKQAAAAKAAATTALVSKSAGPPPYGHRQGWIPRTASDFGNGGAFPEIHVAQFPLDMGRKDKKNDSQTVALTTDSDGNVRYDAILQQGRTHTTLVQANFKDMAPKKYSEEDLAQPDEETVRKETEATREALSLIVTGKLNQVKTAQAIQSADPTFVRYTPANPSEGGPTQRIVKLVEAPVDPLEPPKFKHKKAARSNPSPPVPIMHSPPRKLSQQDFKDWKIPPCISNWKNHKGYTIPLDKRQAADGRTHLSVEINDGFAKLAEALLVAQDSAAQSIKLRQKEREMQQRREKEEKEEELRKLARLARLGKGGVGGGELFDEEEEIGMGGGGGGGGGGRGMAMAMGGGGDDEGGVIAGLMRSAARAEMGKPIEEEDYPMEVPENRRRTRDQFEEDMGETKEERDSRRQRDQLREERRRERERERRMEELDRKGVKLSKLTRDRDRDVSEKIALGMAQKTSGGEIEYDQRLFNQSAGMDQGFGAEDDYNIFDKPLFQGSAANASIYKHKKNDEEQYGNETIENALKNTRFRVDREFAGTNPAARGDSRNEPVQFEKHREEEEDLFGVDKFLTEAKNAKRALDKVGSRGGQMSASGESNYKDAESYGGGGGGRRSRVDFERGGR